MALNDRELVVMMASRQRKSQEHNDMLTIDLQSLKSWHRIKIRDDMRANGLVNFATIPFRRSP